MFQLTDIENTRAWKDVYQKGCQDGLQKGHKDGRQEGQNESAQKLLAKGMSAKEVAELLDMSLREVRQLARNASK